MEMELPWQMEGNAVNAEGRSEGKVQVFNCSSLR